MMDHGCEAYEYNVTDEGTCHLLNGTSSAATTLFSDGETYLYMKGELFTRTECIEFIYLNTSR